MDLQRLSYYCYFFDWCFFFFSLSPPFPQLNADSMWCSLPGKKRTLKELKTKQNYNLNLTFTSSCFFFFLLSWCINKRRAIGILKKKNKRPERDTHARHEQTDTATAAWHQCCIHVWFSSLRRKGIPPKSHYWSFFFFLRFPFRSSTPRQSGRPISRCVACSSNNHKWANNKQSNKWQKKKKQTNKKHASTRK